MKQKDYSGYLMWAAILVSMPRWAGAFISADTAAIPHWVDATLNYANIFAGLGMGFLEVVATAYMLDAWGKMRPKKTWNAKGYDHRWKVLTGFIIALFALMPIILAPYVVGRMTGQGVAGALGNNGLRYLWSFAVILSPAFIIGGVAFSRDGFIGASASIEPAQEGVPALAEQPKPALEPARASYVCEDCNRPFATVQALNAHGRFCSALHPERANGKVKV